MESPLSDSGIYQITNMLTGDFYIGSAVCLSKRWKIHIGGLRSGKHHNPHLQRSWDKYGHRSFFFSVLKFVDDHKNLLTEEQRLIDSEHPSFNLCPIAGSQLGLKRSDAWKAKRRAFKTTDEARANMSKAQQNMTEDTKRKISVAMRGNRNSLGLKRSPETLKRMSQSQKGRNLTEEHKRKLSLAKMGNTNRIKNRK